MRTDAIENRMAINLFCWEKGGNIQDKGKSRCNLIWWIVTHSLLLLDTCFCQFVPSTTCVATIKFVLRKFYFVNTVHRQNKKLPHYFITIFFFRFKQKTIVTQFQLYSLEWALTEEKYTREKKYYFL